MKLLKKLLAVTLAGVLALTMLAGCSGSTALNEKDFIEALNDLDYQSTRLTHVETITAGDNTLARQALGRIKQYAEANPNLYPNLSTTEFLFLNTIRKIAQGEDDPARVLELFPADTADTYYMYFLRLDEFQSQEYQQNRAAHAAELLLYRGQGAAILNSPAYNTPSWSPEKYSTTATASIATETINGHQYLMVIFVQAAK